MNIDSVRIDGMRRDSTRLISGCDPLADQKLSRAIDKVVVDRCSPFSMLDFQLGETLDGIGFFVSVNHSVVRSAHEDQICEGMPRGVCLLIVVARSAGLAALM